MNDLLQRLREMKRAMRLLLSMQRVTIASTRPLTVTLQSGATVAASAVDGLTYTVGHGAVALLAERSQPLVFPVS